MTETTEDLVKRLRYGLIEYPKRWSGDTHSDMGGSVDYDKTYALLDEAANRIEALEAELAKVVGALRVWIDFANVEEMPVSLSDLEAAELTGGKDD